MFNQIARVIFNCFTIIKNSLTKKQVVKKEAEPKPKQSIPKNILNKIQSLLEAENNISINPQVELPLSDAIQNALNTIAMSKKNPDSIDDYSKNLDLSKLPETFKNYIVTVKEILNEDFHALDEENQDYVLSVLTQSALNIVHLMAFEHNKGRNRYSREFYDNIAFVEQDEYKQLLDKLILSRQQQFKDNALYYLLSFIQEDYLLLTILHNEQKTDLNMSAFTQLENSLTALNAPRNTTSRQPVKLSQESNEIRFNKALGIFVALPTELKANVMSFANAKPLTYTSLEDRKSIEVACMLKRNLLRKGS